MLFSEELKRSTYGIEFILINLFRYSQKYRHYGFYRMGKCDRTGPFEIYRSLSHKVKINLVWNRNGVL